MRIERLSKADCYGVLQQLGFGRVACARDGQPYIVPSYFVVGKECIYAFALPGQKVDWMRENPLVCVEVDVVIDANEWTSVIACGRFRELNHPEFEVERTHAHQLLQQRPMWWEPGAITRDGHDGKRGYEPIYYRISVTTISGYRGVRALDEPAANYVPP